MKYFWATLGWLWGKRGFFLTTFLSAALLFAWMFPFGDLSDAVTSAIARGSGNQLYVQFENMNVHFLPTPSVSARQVAIQTAALPPLNAKWIEISPSWFSLIFNLWTIKKAGAGDAEAVNNLGTKLGVNVEAEGVLGGDVNLNVSPGSKSDQGNSRSHVALNVQGLNLNQVQKWADLPVKMQGRADLQTDFQIVPSFSEQPDGDVSVKIAHFDLPASTVMVPVGGSESMPVSLPQIRLANVNLKGHLSAGTLSIEDGHFGSAADPFHGRIKGQLGLQLSKFGDRMVPMFGSYNLTVEMDVSQQIEKEVGFVFLLFDSAKTPTATGAHYLFRAMGAGLGGPPSITRLSTF